MIRPLHIAKEFVYMLVTEFGIITEVRSVHQEKALLPMLVTEFGIVNSLHVKGTKYKAVLSGPHITPSSIIAPSAGY